MGWWGVEKNGNVLEIGDQPLDALDSALKKVIKSYEGAFKRRPTPDELTELLEMGIRAVEVELFDDMEERELESVIIRLRPSPMRQKLKPGDYFAIPLPSGGYGYGRIMKVTLKTLLWMRLLRGSSEKLLTFEGVHTWRKALDIQTRTSEIDNGKWPIIGHLPFLPQEQAALSDEPHWITNYTVWDIEQIAEWKSADRKGLPPNMDAPYVGYRDS